jgi:hypothetical protein
VDQLDGIWLAQGNFKKHDPTKLLKNIVLWSKVKHTSMRMMYMTLFFREPKQLQSGQTVAEQLESGQASTWRMVGSGPTED